MLWRASSRRAGPLAHTWTGRSTRRSLPSGARRLSPTQDPLHSSNPLQKDRFESLTESGYFSVLLTGYSSTPVMTCVFPDRLKVQRVRPTHITSRRTIPVSLSPERAAAQEKTALCVRTCRRACALEASHVGGPEASLSDKLRTALEEHTIYYEVRRPYNIMLQTTTPFTDAEHTSRHAHVRMQLRTLVQHGCSTAPWCPSNHHHDNCRVIRCASACALILIRYASRCRLSMPSRFPNCGRFGLPALCDQRCAL